MMCGAVTTVRPDNAEQRDTVLKQHYVIFGRTLFGQETKAHEGLFVCNLRVKLPCLPSIICDPTNNRPIATATTVLTNVGVPYPPCGYAPGAMQMHNTLKGPHGCVARKWTPGDILWDQLDLDRAVAHAVVEAILTHPWSSCGLYVALNELTVWPGLHSPSQVQRSTAVCVAGRHQPICLAKRTVWILPDDAIGRCPVQPSIRRFHQGTVCRAENMGPLPACSFHQVRNRDARCILPVLES